ncbi:Gldg family protein [Porphyromonas sp.]|uniref:Gldg family protein n=1 Tax=Porphyromonas sp. TaxID=1924944 RepID=UPI0026DC1F3B|nr:Gldg family protein [Porphyromonas sp.]MDO4770410.1 Gldg family protein [Porphyromonas sp.]
MKIILKIAKAELQVLFFSPIAWLILILFTFTVSTDLLGILKQLVQNLAMGYPLHDLTSYMFSGWEGIYSKAQGNLYLYLPLLTMNLMSREYSSGSIKLLYSSPVTNAQIILGKYLSVVVYILVLIAVLGAYAVWGAVKVDHFNYEVILSGLLGIFLLTCAYAVIGLFMSSLTSYQVVAAVGTLTILTLLSMVSSWGQDIAFVRDITYWLSMTGRSSEFIQGMISTENVLYFIIVIVLFLSMAILRLQSLRTSKPTWVVVSQYASVWIIALGLGYVSSQPMAKKYYDATTTKRNTITSHSQDIVKRLDGKVTITSYVNLLDPHFWIGMPERINEDRKLFEQYLRFKPDMKMKYVYYYHEANNPSFDQRFPDLTTEEKFNKMIEINNFDPKMFLTPDEFARLGVDLSGEGYRFVREIEYNGKKTFLRIFDDNMIFPLESEITAALKRLVMDLPMVGFLSGKGARPTDHYSERAYSMFAQMKNFRHSLINQGFAYSDISIDQDIPEDINILVIGELREPLSDVELARIQAYIDRGGNLLITGDPGRQEVMNPIVEMLGVRFSPGHIVHPTVEYSADLALALPTKEAGELSHMFGTLRSYGYGVAMSGATSVEYDTDKGFEVVSLMKTDSVGCWNELETTDFLNDSVRLNPAIGEVEKSYDLAIALTRQVGERTQKIIVAGDADCISNGEVMRERPGVKAFNYYMILGAFDWFSDGEVPIDVRRPDSPDKHMELSDATVTWARVVFVWLIPGLMFLTALFIWLRRRGR